MKKFFTFLLLAVLVCGSFAQSPLKVLFLVYQIPYGDNHDEPMETILNDLGYDLTIEVATATSPTTGYDLVVISESCGSRDPVYANYKTAPLPLFVFKVHALKDVALNWLDGPGVTNTDYGNTYDSVLTVSKASHPILTGLTGKEIQIADNVQTGLQENILWCKMPPTSGQTTVATCGTTDKTLQSLLAFEKNATLGPTTIDNRAVIIGFHQTLYEYLNDNGKTIISNACNWAAGREIVNVSNNLAVQTSIFPNPSSGSVNLQFSQSLSDISVKVLSIVGKEVFSKQLLNTRFAELDLSELNSGMYFISIEGPDLSHTEKLIIK